MSSKDSQPGSSGSTDGDSRSYGFGPRLAVRFAALVLAILTIGLVAEGGLRLWAALAIWQRDRGGATQGAVILCHGDSWTYGLESGDPGTLSYPAQLQALLDRRLGKGRYRVINRGRPGLTSRQIRSELPDLVQRYRPIAVVLLVGSANFFQSVGASPSGEPVSRLDRLGARSRLVSVLRLLSRPPGQGFSLPDPTEVKGRLAQVLTERPGPQGPLEAPGTPPYLLAGCQSPGELGPREASLDLAIPYGCESVMGVLSEEPLCQQLWVQAAERCLLGKQPECALRIARLLQERAGDDPRERMVLAEALHQREGRFSSESLEHLRLAVDMAPGYCRARRLLGLAQLAMQGDLCNLTANLEQAVAVCKASGWPEAALNILRRTVEAPGQQALAADLRAAADQLAQQADGRLLVLNYAPTEADACGTLARAVIQAEARRLDLPYLDIETLLGAKLADKPSAYFAKNNHPSALGYRRIAEAVFARLLRDGWIAKPGR